MGFQNAGRAAPDSPGNGPLDAHSSAACCNSPNNAVTLKNQAGEQARQRLRRQRLVERLHRLGPAPLYHFLTEVERGAPLWPHVERYVALPAAFIKANGGDRFAPSLHCIDLP